MCPSTKVVPHHLPADQISSNVPANRHLWHVHAGHDVVHENGLTLVHPAHPDAPIAEYPAPASLHIPRAQQRPMAIQLPTPGRTGARAARLATAITHGGDDAVSPAVPVGTQDPGWPLVEQATLDAPSWRPTGHQRQPRRGEMPLCLLTPLERLRVGGAMPKVRIFRCSAG
jgi:hypothetical protein